MGLVSAGLRWGSLGLTCGGRVIVTWLLLELNFFDFRCSIIFNMFLRWLLISLISRSLISNNLTPSVPIFLISSRSQRISCDKFIIQVCVVVRIRYLVTYSKLVVYYMYQYKANHTVIANMCHCWLLCM